MGSLFGRIAGRITATCSKFRNDCRFSFKLAVYRICDELCGRIGLKRISKWGHKKLAQWILKYLAEVIEPAICNARQNPRAGEYSPNAPIWICWWTGEHTAPPLVKQCIASIRSQAGEHPVHIITKDNFGDYLEIPAFILDKVENKQMCIANFSDYLRFSLLAKYGGIWLDATIYCTQPLGDTYFRVPVFTCKSPEQPTDYISRYRWTAFCFGGYQGNALFQFMHEAFTLYWKVNQTSIDYLLVDYLIETAYSHIPEIRAWLDAVPYNNLSRDDLQAAMNAALPAEAWQEILQPDTQLYKLSWRETYQECTPDGKKTVYGYLLGL